MNVSETRGIKTKSIHSVNSVTSNEENDINIRNSEIKTKAVVRGFGSKDYAFRMRESSDSRTYAKLTGDQLFDELCLLSKEKLSRKEIVGVPECYPILADNILKHTEWFRDSDLLKIALLAHNCSSLNLYNFVTEKVLGNVLNTLEKRMNEMEGCDLKDLGLIAFHLSKTGVFSPDL